MSLGNGTEWIAHECRPMVYIAGPYSHPDAVENSHNAILVADRLDATGVITPCVPHLSLLWQMVRPHADVGFWYDLDIAFLARCDALLRIPGASSGADDEIAFAKEVHMPVFYQEPDVIEWAQEWLGSR